MPKGEEKIVGVIGSVQFEGWGVNSGQAQIVINRNMKGERRFVLGVTKADASLNLFEDALKAMWSAKPVEVTCETTENLPVIKSIAKPSKKA